MKTLIVSFFLIFQSIQADFKIENNAHMCLFESVEEELYAYFIFEGHEYVAPVVEHHIYCPCLDSP